MSKTFTHEKARIDSLSGFTIKIPSAANVLSNVNATYHSAVHHARVALVPGTTQYTLQLPAGAFIDSISTLVTTLFDGSSPTVQVGSTLNGSDVLGATATSSTGGTIAMTVVPVITGNVLFIKINGASTVGVGYVIVRYSVI